VKRENQLSTKISEAYLVKRGRGRCKDVKIIDIEKRSRKMRKLKIYLDTTIINFAVSEREHELVEKEETKALLEKIKQGEIDGVISVLVIKEIDAADEARRSLLKSVIKDLPLEIMEIDEDVKDLADKYIENGIIPKKHEEDAVHIAAATIINADAIVSWNFEHMVKMKTRRGVKAINELNGYRYIDIVEPKEVE